MSDFELASVESLRPHKANMRIYGDAHIPDAGMFESVKERGVLTPLRVTTEGVILSGHRRWLAAKQAGLKQVPVVRVDVPDEAEQVVVLIEANIARPKDNEMKGRECFALFEIYKGRYGSGLTAAKVAQVLGMHHNTVDRLHKVMRAINTWAEEGGEVNVGRVRERLATSILGAYELVQEILHPPEEPEPTPSTDPEIEIEDTPNPCPPAPARVEKRAEAQCVEDLADDPDTVIVTEDDGDPNYLSTDDEPPVTRRAPATKPTGAKVVAQEPEPEPDHEDHYEVSEGVDTLGIPLSEREGAAEVFADCGALSDLIREAEALHRRASALVARPIGAWIRRQGVAGPGGGGAFRTKGSASAAGVRFESVDLLNFITLLKNGMPTTVVCPGCYDESKRHNDGSCKICGGLPYVVAVEYHGGRFDRRNVNRIANRYGVTGGAA